MNPAERSLSVAFALAAMAFGCGGATAAQGPDAGTFDGASTGDARPFDAVGPNIPPSGPDAAGVTDADPPSSPCGTRIGMRALTSRTLTVAGLARTYHVYLPAGLPPATPAPLVFVHHGYTMSGQEMVAVTAYTTLADSEGFALAFPDGEAGPDSLGAPWNVGANVCAPGNLEDASGDDFDFVTAMQADIQQDQCVDEQHVFLTGFSMGGFFAHEVGCMRPDLARAVAPHSGGTHDFSTCVAGHKPVIIFHGDADPLIPESCDTTAASQWVTKNGCSTTVNTVAVENGHCDYYEGCPADGQVAICVFNGMGHCWAGGAPEAGVFSCPLYASATELEWSFFKQYAW